MKQKILDSHVHFWDTEKLNYGWLESVTDLNRTFLPEDFAKASHFSNIKGLIFVQAECVHNEALAEVSFVTTLAKNYPLIHGIVAQCSVEKGREIQSHLAQLKKNSLVKGVRRLLQDETNDFCLQQNFIQGVQLLADFGFSFDICIKAQQLPAVNALVKQCPNVLFILDHCGKPDIARQQFKRWQADLSQLALQPNVVCKLSGLITEADHQHWQPAELQPYILHACEVFGENRILFGSDWPVMNLAGNYQRWVEVVSELLSTFSDEAQQKIFYRNARRWYRI